MDMHPMCAQVLKKFMKNFFREKISGEKFNIIQKQAKARDLIAPGYCTICVTQREDESMKIFFTGFK